MAEQQPGTAYQPLAKLDTPQLLAARRKELESARTDDVRNWALNRAFYRGDQWIIWNRLANQVESLPVADGDKPRWKVRLTSNQILPGMQHYVSQLTKTRPVIHALPDSGTDKDIKAAQTAEALYEWWWRDLNLDLKLQSALIETGISQAYWKITWDPLAGKAMTFVVGPDGQPIMDEELADLFLEQLQQQGIDPVKVGVKRTVYVGDICVEVLPGENVVSDRTVRHFEDSSWVICKHAMSPEDVASRWNQQLQPNSMPTQNAAPLAYHRDENTHAKSTVDVYILYVRPSAAAPQGRMAAWCEAPMKMLQDDPWPYPTHDLPIVKFPGFERPGSPIDEPIVTHARPLQKEFNRTLSQLVQFKDLSIKPQVFAPAGSLRTKLTDEPGAAFEYNPINNLKPEWRQPPILGSEGFQILGEIQSRLDTLFNRVPTERSQLPARVDSGNTVSLIQEAVADQLTPVVRRIENSLAKAGSLMVALAHQYYTEPRIIKMIGPGGSVRARKFMSTDLDGGFSFHAVSGTGLPRSREGRFQQIKEMLELQLIDPQTALKHLDLADVRGVKDKIAADEDQALREHDKLLRGIPVNPWNLQQADAAISQGRDPETGQPLTEDPTTARQEAGLQPLDFENWEAHIDVHSTFMKTTEFENWPPQAQMMLLQHYNATYERLMQVKQFQLTMDPKVMPGINVAARTTVTAPVMVEILKRHGIMVDESAVLEEPLETMVYDSIDKPDADATSDDPLTPQEIALYEESIQKQTGMQQQQQQQSEAHGQKMQQQQDLHALQVAQASHQIAQGRQQHEQSHEQHGQKMQHQQQQHTKKLKEKPAQAGGSSGGKK